MRRLNAPTIAVPQLWHRVSSSTSTDATPSNPPSTTTTTGSSSTGKASSSSYDITNSSGGSRSLVSSQGNLIMDRLPPRPTAVARTSAGSSDEADSQRTGPSSAQRQEKEPPPLKVKRKAPWGSQQLRDAWSVDAMTKGERDNMNERLHREYRYHPHEQQRRALKWMALSLMPSFVAGMSVAYYYYEGKFLWQGDPQYALNMIRSVDTSPRSGFYPWRMAGQEDLPEHIAKYRQQRRAEIEQEKAAAAERLRQAEAAVEAAIQGSVVTPLSSSSSSSHFTIHKMMTQEEEATASRIVLPSSLATEQQQTPEDEAAAVSIVPQEEKPKPIQYFRITGMAGTVRGVISEEAEA